MHQSVYPYLDLRIDHHENPIAELRYLFEESRKDYYQLFRSSMPIASTFNLGLTRTDELLLGTPKKAIAPVV